MKSKVLVTGGLGYIGSHTVVELIDAGYEVFIIDNLINSSESVLANIENTIGVKPNFFKADLTNLEEISKIIKSNNIQSVIHFAAHLFVDESVLKPMKYYRNNVVGLLNLLEVCEENEIKEFVFSSSCAVYGDKVKMPVSESDLITQSSSPYGNTKIVGELMLQDFIQANPNFNSTILRYFNPVGAHQKGFLGELSLNGPKHLFPIIINNINNGKATQIYGDDYPTRDGTCIRDYVHVTDIAKAHVMSLKHMKTNDSSNLNIFNLGSGKGITVLEILKEFENELSNKISYKIVDRRAGDAIQIWSDTKKAKEKLGWEPKMGLKEMVSSALKWEENKIKVSDAR